MKRTHKNYTTLNLNLFPIMAVAMVAALSGGMLGCGDDRSGCMWETGEDGKEYWTCRDDDGDIDRRSPAGEDTCVLSHSYINDSNQRVFVCMDGSEFVATGGEDGKDGTDGTDGIDGIDGGECALTQVGDTCTLTCPGNSVTFWCGSTPPGGTCTPSAEVCDGVDNDCDGLVDEGNVCGGSSCQPTPEICDGVDNDCDGQIDEGVCGGTTTAWQVLAMGIQPSDPLFTCNGTPITPSTNCNGTIAFNRGWLETRTAQVYSGAFTELSLLGSAGYSESFSGLLGAYCAIQQNSNCGPSINVGGAPVGAATHLVNDQGYGEHESAVEFNFESGDNCSVTVVCSLSVDRYAFWLDGMSQPMSLDLSGSETNEELLAYKVSVPHFSPAVRAFLLSFSEQ